MHCRLNLAHPPCFAPEPALAGDRVLRWLEATWMMQQLPWAVLFYAAGGLPWLVWGVPVRVAACVTGHWLVGHVTHRRGPAGWVVDGAAVQGHDLAAAALITFGEAWHGNHRAWPESARLGLGPGQPDPGWWVLLAMRRLGPGVGPAAARRFAAEGRAAAHRIGRSAGPKQAMRLTAQTACDRAKLHEPAWRLRLCAIPPEVCLALVAGD